LKADDIPRSIKGYDALIVRGTRITREAIEAADDLNLIIRAGAGTDTIDKAKASEMGIHVCNTPGKNAVAVAELAFGLLMAIDRNIPDNVRELREGKWNKKKFTKTRGLLGRTVGVVGLGQIGLAFAERARAFGLRVYGVRKDNRSEAILERIESIGIDLVNGLATLAETCDILSFHVPANDETKGMINREFLAHVKPGAVIINTSRGSIMDDEALIEAMDEKDIRVGLDVYNDEPGTGEAEFSTPLTRHPNVYGTHHIGASTEQAQNAIAAEVVRVLHAFDRGHVIHCVNMEAKELGTSVLSVRHFDKVGVLSSVFNVLKRARINVEQMDNQVFTGAKAACASLHVSGEVTPEVLAEIQGIEEVIHISVKQR